MSAPERIYRSETRSPTHVIYYGEDRRAGENIAYIRADIHKEAKAEIDALKAELAGLKEWCYSDQELAIKILSYLGFSQDPSKEPYADRRRDHIAEMIFQNCEPVRKELAALKAPEV